MRWPRGRYNGHRIVGISVRVRIDITRWRLAWPWPWLRLGTCLSIGPVHVWMEPAYE